MVSEFRGADMPGKKRITSRKTKAPQDNGSLPPDNVIDLDSYRRGWKVGHARCGSCGYRYVTVYGPLTKPYRLECGKCHKSTGVDCDAWDWVP